MTTPTSRSQQAPNIDLNSIHQSIVTLNQNFQLFKEDVTLRLDNLNTRVTNVAEKAEKNCCQRTVEDRDRLDKAEYQIRGLNTLYQRVTDVEKTAEKNCFKRTVEDRKSLTDISLKIKGLSHNCGYSYSKDSNSGDRRDGPFN